jgi:hypothetical protein
MPYIMTGYGDVAYLLKVTEFMTACRQEDTLAGMWDVGDLPWWWRDDEYADPTMQMFWEDRQGTIGGFVPLSQGTAVSTMKSCRVLGRDP